MIRFEDINAIYICTGATDLRKGIDGYASIVQSEFELSPFDSSLYIFCNRQHNKIKCLYWDGTGFWLLYKRLEKGHFKWNNTGDRKAVEITSQQVKWLLEGLKMEQKTAFKTEHPKYV